MFVGLKALFACLLTVFWMKVGAAVEPTVVRVKEGSDAVLPCLLRGENIELKLFDWRKKDDQTGVTKEVFMYEGGDHYNNGRSGQDEQFRGRVSHFKDDMKNGNASIIIRNPKVIDSGNYTCDFPLLKPQKTFHIQLVVGAAPEPYVTALNETKDWSLLQCDIRGASPKPQLQWQDSDGNLVPAKAPQVSERGGSYDIILQATVTKTDTYRCVVTQEEIHHQTQAEIYVYINGAASKPFVTILRQTEDGFLLQCEVLGVSPKPQLQWQDSDGNLVPAKDPQEEKRGGGYDIILQAAVTKTDTYRCVVTQKEIHHQTQAEIYVPPIESSTGWIVAVVVVLVLIVIVVVLVIRCYQKKRTQEVER